MRTSLQDLIATCPNQLEAWSIIVYDWCNRVLEQIPDGITCEDVLGCIDCEALLDIITFGNGLIVDTQACTVTVDPQFINDNITTSFNCATGTPLLVVGNTTMDLSCILNSWTLSFQDGLNTYTAANWDLIFVQGLHGMQCVVGNQLIQVDLPSGGTNGQVLTWNATASTAYRANPLTICCDQIIGCVQPLLDMIQNQINLIVQQLCPCTGGGGTWALDVYDNDVPLIWGSNVPIISFNDCLVPSVNSLNPNIIDVDFVPSMSFDCITDPQTGLITWGELTLCGTTVDLSCIFTPSLVVTLDSEPISNQVLILNFQSCLTASSVVPGVVDVGIDMSCLQSALIQLPTDNTIFVMKNWNDVTGQIERLDLPFLTLSAAHTAAQASWKRMLIYVFPWDYSTETISLWWTGAGWQPTDYYLEKWTVIKWIHLNQYTWDSSVKWNGTLRTDQTSTGNIFAIQYTSNTQYSDVYIELDDVYLSDILSWTWCNMMRLVQLSWDTVVNNRLTLRTKQISVSWLNSNNPNYAFISVAGDNNFIDASLWKVRYAYVWGTDEPFSWYHVFTWSSLYLHHTYFSNRYLLNGVETQIPMKEYAQFINDGRVYLDNIYNEWRMKPNASSNALIVIWMNTNTHWELILNDCLWDIRDPDEVTPGNEKLIYVFDGNVYCYGMNHIMQWIHYDTSMYSTAPAWQVDCTGIYRGDKDATSWILWVAIYRNCADWNLGDVKFPYGLM